MKIVTPAQMREIEQYHFTVLQKSSRAVMQKAGECVARYITEHFPKASRVLCVCGAGNNGGDGFVCANALILQGYTTDILFVGDSQKLSADAAYFYNRIKDYTVKAAGGKYDLIIDALFGIGFHGRANGLFEQAIMLMNKLREDGATLIAIDVPSGLDEKGSILDISGGKADINGDKPDAKVVKADVTLTFQYIKTGHIIGNGLNYTGDLQVCDIGLTLPEGFTCNYELLTPEKALHLLPVRKRCSHKGTYGHVGVLAGSCGMEGAALLCAFAALKAGAGKVTIGADESLQGFLNNRPWEIMCTYFQESSLGYENALDDFLAGKDVILLGPGLGRNKTKAELVQKVIRSEKPLVLDADALFALGKDELNQLKSRTAPCILTPHIGEAARLLNCGISEIEADPIGAVTKLCGLTGQTVVLKSAYTLIGHKDEIIFNSYGNAGMATAGSGDVLSGIVAGLLHQLGDPFKAAQLGVYIHAKAGDLAAKQLGQYAMTAGDLLNKMHDAFLSIEK